MSTFRILGREFQRLSTLSHVFTCKERFERQHKKALPVQNGHRTFYRQSWSRRLRPHSFSMQSSLHQLLTRNLLLHLWAYKMFGINDILHGMLRSLAYTPYATSRQEHMHAGVEVQLCVCFACRKTKSWNRGPRHIFGGSNSLLGSLHGCLA